MTNIKKIREERGISQKAIAITLRVSQPTVCEWESGRKTPSSKNASRLADILNVSVDYLLGRTEDPTPPDLQKKRPSDEERLNEELDNIYNYIKSQPVEEQERLTAILRDVLAAVRQGRGE